VAHAFSPHSDLPLPSLSPPPAPSFLHHILTHLFFRPDRRPPLLVLALLQHSRLPRYVFFPSSPSSPHLSFPLLASLSADTSYPRLRPQHPKRKDALRRFDAAHPEPARDERHVHDERGGGRAGLYGGAGTDYAGVGEYWNSFSFLLSFSFFLVWWGGWVWGGVRAGCCCAALGVAYRGNRHRVPAYEMRWLTGVASSLLCAHEGGCDTGWTGCFAGVRH
jgi:hypothetical protein